MIGMLTLINTWLTKKAASYLKLMERLERKAEEQKAQREEDTHITQKQKQSSQPKEV
mgnify:CR=1 FL=1